MSSRSSSDLSHFAAWRREQRQGPPDWWTTARIILAILLVTAIVVSVMAIVGCSGGTPQVQVARVEGSGAIDINVCMRGDDGVIRECIPTSLAFREVAVETADGHVVCSVVDLVQVAGVVVPGGVLPEPLSDPECAEVLDERPFLGRVSAASDELVD